MLLANMYILSIPGDHLSCSLPPDCVCLFLPFIGSTYNCWQIRRTFNLELIRVASSQMKYYKELGKKRRKMQENPQQIARNKVRRIFSSLTRKREKLYFRVFFSFFSFHSFPLLLFAYFSGTTRS